MPSIPGLESFNWVGMVDSTMYWVTIILVSLLMIAIFVVGYYFLTFNIKATVFPIYGSGKDGVFAVGKKSWNRCKWIKNRTAWKSMFPLFSNKEIEPFDSEYIYPGKQIYVFDLNGVWSPMRINIEQKEEKIRGDIAVVPYYVRNWQSLQHKKNAIEYAAHTWWDDNKIMVTALMFGIAMLIATCVVIWLTYKFAWGGKADIGRLSDALQNFGNIPGGNPPM